jgi:DNA-binding NtrC family response regulator
MGSRRILIVDDEQGIRKLLAIAFGRAGYEVRVAADAQQAMVICESEGFDVLLSDVVMPGTNGQELARWMATHHPSTRTVLMSGFDDSTCELSGIPAQQCPSLSKPFLPSHAIALVDGVLARVF